MAFRVLSIDGGGMRGIYTATYLDALDKAFTARRKLSSGLDIGKGFNLIVGTSTGAIIGCGLAKGISAGEIASLYENNGHLIFPKKIPGSINLDLLWQLKTRPKYVKQGNDSLIKALTDVFGDMTIAKLWHTRKIALAIPAVHMANYKSWVFKTPHNPSSNHRDDSYSLVDVCLASSAAPLFRSLAAINTPECNSYRVFADGGLWANNPVFVALTEALTMVGNSHDEIEIFCLGSCGKPEGELIDYSEVHRGLTEWKFGSDVAKVSIAAQEFAFDKIAQLLLPHFNKKIRILRFPAEKIPAYLLDYLDLDETRPEGLRALKQQACHDADMTNSEIQRDTSDGRMIGSLFSEIPSK
jgi:uncharacterized protein